MIMRVPSIYSYGRPPRRQLENSSRNCRSVDWPLAPNTAPVIDPPSPICRAIDLYDFAYEASKQFALFSATREFCETTFNRVLLILRCVSETSCKKIYANSVSKKVCSFQLNLLRRSSLPPFLSNAMGKETKTNGVRSSAENNRPKVI